MLFNALWKDKRMEMILSDIWKEQAATSKLCRGLPGQSPLQQNVYTIWNVKSQSHDFIYR